MGSGRERKRTVKRKGVGSREVDRSREEALRRRLEGEVSEMEME
jgi:hypothetical protein